MKKYQTQIDKKDAMNNFSIHELYEQIFESKMKDCPNRYIDPISKLIMHDPVKTCRGKIYERESIEYEIKNSKEARDPLTREKLVDLTLEEAVDLKKEIQQFLKENPYYRYIPSEHYFPSSYIEHLKNNINNMDELKKVIQIFPTSIFSLTSVDLSQKQKQKKCVTKANVSVFDCLYRNLAKIVKRKNEFNTIINKSESLSIIFEHYNTMKHLFEYRLKNLNEQKNMDNICEIRETKQVLNNFRLSFTNLLPNSVRLFPSKKLIEYLINELEVPINVKNQYNQNAFHVACISNELEIAKFLYEKQKSICKGSTIKPIYEELHSDQLKQNWKPFHIAIWNRSDKIIEWMMSEELKETFFTYEDCSVKDKSRVSHAMNCISLSVYKNNHKLTEKLIRDLHSTTDITSYTKNYNLLYWACIVGDTKEFKKLCELYRELKGSKFLNDRLKDINIKAFKRGIIHAIAMEGDEELMNIYLKYCEEFDIKENILNSCDFNRSTAIHYACDKSKFEIVKLLKNHKIDLFKINKNYKTCFDLTKDVKIKNFLCGYFISKTEEISDLKKEIDELKQEIKQLKRSRNDLNNNNDDDECLESQTQSKLNKI
jgi:ankyrin repeat protein